MSDSTGIIKRHIANVCKIAQFKGLLFEENNNPVSFTLNFYSWFEISVSIPVLVVGFRMFHLILHQLCQVGMKNIDVEHC